MTTTLHIFNPEHDIALASNLANFTAPHAGRQLRNDLGWLPALWAREGDRVLVENVEYAERTWRRMCSRIVSRLETDCFLRGNSLFLAEKQLVSTQETNFINPWGWDKALCASLRRHGMRDALLPTDEQLATVRTLSHRRVAGRLLQQLRRAGTVGEAFECSRVEQVAEHLQHFGRVVVKAPWSSSGRGVRFLSLDHSQPSVHNWLCNVMTAQGSVMVEPYYNKVKDFGMEFEALADGTVRCLGLSLFHTQNGAYTGNILATERTKRELMSRYVPVELLDAVAADICRLTASLFCGRYTGPFGVDMMVVEGHLLHPCVEINLRRTMGHVALALTPADDDIRRVMRIDYNGNNYKLHIRKL